MKKLLVVVLTVLLALSMVACSTGTAAETQSSEASEAQSESAAAPESESAPESAAEEPADSGNTAGGDGFRLAVGMPDSGTSAFVIMANNVKQMCAEAGGTAVFEPGGSNADALIAFAEKQIAAGSDAIVFTPVADSVLPPIMNLCEEAGVYWGIIMRTIQDEEIAEMVKGSEYYIGNVYENETKAGYDITKYVADQGYKKIAILSGALGDASADLREKGMNEVVSEYGMEVVAEARSLTQATEVTTAAESFLSSHDDLDLILIVSVMVPGATDAVGKAIVDAGRGDDVKIASVDFLENSDQWMNDGILIGVAGCPFFGLDTFMVSAKAVNAITGNNIAENGKNFETMQESILVTDAAEMSNCAKVINDENTLYFDDMQATVLNPDLDETTFSDLIKQVNDNVIK